MDVHIVIKDNTLRGVATSMLLAVVGILFVIIVQSVREGITFWLYKYFPKNKGKLYVMATSRAGSYLDVIGLFSMLGGFPMFIVLFVMILGTLGNIFSGLVVGTKNVPMDLCTENECFSTGFGKNLLDGYNITGIAPQALMALTSMDNFVFQDMNNTITSGLPWSGSRAKTLVAANVPSEIHQIPLERLKRRVEYTGVFDIIAYSPVNMGVEYVNGTFLDVRPGVALVSDNSIVSNWSGWNIYDLELSGVTNRPVVFKMLYFSTSTVTDINLLLGSAMVDGIGSDAFIREAQQHLVTNDTLNYIKKITYYGFFTHQSMLGTVDLTFRSRNEGPVNQLEFSTYDNLKFVKRADPNVLFNATLDNLQDNLGVLSNYSRQFQGVSGDLFQSSTTSGFFDLSSYITTCLTMAVSQTRPIGMIRGYEQANVITPVISIKLVLLVPLLLVTIVFFVPYAIVTLKLYNDDDRWLPYKFHVDPREYIINLCYSRFTVVKPMTNKELSDIIHGDYGDNGPIFDEHEDKMI